MPVILSNSLILAGDEAIDQPLTHPRIGWHTITRTGDVSASSTALTFLTNAPANGLTYEYWRPSSLPAWWKVDNGEDVEVNYLGIAAHTCGTEQSSVYLEYSDDDTSWTEAASYAPGDDRPIMLLFEAATARYWRVRFTGSTAPRVGVIYIGKVLEMQRAVYGGVTPSSLARNTEIRPNTSEGGQFLGRSIRRDGISTSVRFQNLTASWYRNNFDPFVLNARRYPFFFAWRPATFPNEIVYGWTTGDVTPSNSGTRNLMSVSMSFDGLAGYE